MADTHDIVVPDLGESVVEATVAEWLKSEGDRVQIGDILVELETDKVNLEVGADHSGVLAKIQVEAGQDVAIGDVLGQIEAREAEADEEPADDGDGDGEDADAADADDAEKPAGTRKNGRGKARESAKAEAAAEESAEVDDSGDGRADGAEDADAKAETSTENEATDTADADRTATPVARRLAEESELDLGTIRGTGPRGRVTREDVERALETQGGPDGDRTSAARAEDAEADEAAGADEAEGAEEAEGADAAKKSAAEADRPEERQRMSRRRRTIAERLVESQRTAAILTTFNDVDMGPVMDLRRRINPDFQDRHGVKLGITTFFVKAAVVALREFPEINAEIDGDDIVYKGYYDIGVAIGHEEGLVVPVIRNADRLSFMEIERTINDYVQKVRDNELSVEDLRGGTFSITNGGVFGSLLSTPILNPPQVGILGLHRIEERPVAQDGEVLVRPMMYMALSYDHRIVDGREAVQFLGRIKALVEDPGAMLVAG